MAGADGLTAAAGAAPRIIVMALVAVILAVGAGRRAAVVRFDRRDVQAARSFDRAMTRALGRSAAISLGADMALDLPFGIGPLQFHNYFPKTPTIPF